MKNLFPKIVLPFSFFLLVISSNFIVAQNDIDNFQLPQYEKVIMDNGLTVYLMEQHEVPLVNISLVTPGGAVKDANLYGLASLTADGLLFGTKSYSKSQIEEKLDFIGATYNTSASKEFARISISYVNKDQQIVMEILKDLIINPTFNEDEFEKRKKLVLSNLERAKESPSSVIRTYFDKFLFGDHVYGNPVSGTSESVAKISVNDLKEFYKNNYYPSGSAIAVVGDFNLQDMKSDIAKVLKDWNTKGNTRQNVQKENFSFNNNRLLLVNKDDATETRFLIGSYGIKRSNPDFIAVEVINTIFGGRFTSWLNDELRVNRGLTYGARSSFSAYKNSGTFVISTFTKTETTIETIDAALELLDKLHTLGINDETLNSAKNYVKGQYPPDFETSGELASLLTDMFIYNFNESFINDFQKNVDDLTVEKTKEIVTKYFPKENLQFVLIGKASEIRDGVKKYGEISEKDINGVGF